MQMVVTAADYQNGGGAASKVSAVERKVGSTGLKNSNEIKDGWLENPLLPQCWKIKLKTWSSPKNDKVHRGFVFKTSDGTILRGIKHAMAHLKTSPEFTMKDVRRWVEALR